MESEKVKEIKKGLECCQEESLKSCEHCPYWNWCKEDDGLTFKSDILTLINELESENERLKKTNCSDCAGCTQWKCDCENIKAYELEKFAERLKGKKIRRQEFIGELVIDDIEYVNVKDIDKTLMECIK